MGLEWNGSSEEQAMAPFPFASLDDRRRSGAFCFFFSTSWPMACLLDCAVHPALPSPSPTSFPTALFTLLARLHLTARGVGTRSPSVPHGEYSCSRVDFFSMGTGNTARSLCWWTLLALDLRWRTGFHSLIHSLIHSSLIE